MALPRTNVNGLFTFYRKVGISHKKKARTLVKTTFTLLNYTY